MKHYTIELPIKLDLQMSRVQSNTRGNYWQLRAIDGASRLVVFEVELNNDQFSDLLSCRNVPEAEGKLYQSINHGKRMEAKTVTVTVPDDFDRSRLKIGMEMEALVALAQDEQDKLGEGWIIDVEREWNSHRWNHQTKTYRLTARRWVAAE